MHVPHEDVADGYVPCVFQTDEAQVVGGDAEAFFTGQEFFCNNVNVIAHDINGEGNGDIQAAGVADKLVMERR